VRETAEVKSGLPAIPAGAPYAEQIESIERIKHLPKEVGVLLLVAGVGGLLLPGPVGTPFVLLAAVVLWPSLFERVELFFERHCPNMHRAGVRQIKRYLSDLERRYPSQSSSRSRNM
jgi:hypothetical protein